MDQGLDSVAKPSAAIVAAEALRKLSRDFFDGQEAVWKASTEYLPLMEGEDRSAWGYVARLKRSRIVPYTRRAVLFAEGQVFQKPIKFAEDVPVAIRGQAENKEKGLRLVVGWMENIDLQGRNGWRFFRERFRDRLLNGVTVWVADSPPADGARTQGEDKRRPYLVGYHPSCLLDVRCHSTPAGRRRVEHVRLSEKTDEVDPKDKFSTVCVERVRVYDSEQEGDVRLTVYVKGEDSHWQIDQPERSISGLVDIPVTICGDPYGVGVFHDLAHLNAALYRKESDRSQTELYCVPQPYITKVGLNAEELKNGVVRAVDRVLLLPGEQTLGFWQADPSSLVQMATSIGELKREIEEESLRAMLDNAPGEMTATQVAVSTGQNVSRLQAEWLDFADCIELSLIDLARLGGKGSDGGKVDKERTWQDLRPDQVQAQWAEMLVRLGVLSKQGLFEVAQRQRAIPDDLEYETEQERISQNEPTLGTVGEGARTARRIRELIASGVAPEEAAAQAEAELEDQPEEVA